MDISFLFSLPFTSCLFSAICKASSDNHFAVLNLFFLGMVLIIASCTMSWTSVHSFSGTLSDLTPWAYLSLLLYKGFNLGHPWMAQWFSYFLQFKSEFSNKEFMIWAIVSSQSCFCWLYRAYSSLAAKNIINLILVLTAWWCPWVGSSLVLLEEGICYDQCVLLANSVSLCPASFCTQGQTYLSLQINLDFLLWHSSPLW